MSLIEKVGDPSEDDYHKHEADMQDADNKSLYYYATMTCPAFDELSDYDKASYMSELNRLNTARHRRGIPDSEDWYNK